MKKIVLLIGAIFYCFSINIANNYQDKIVARINDQIILQSELNQRLMGKNNVTEKEKKEVLNKIIQRKIIFLEASEDKDINVPEDEIEKKVDERINKMISKMGGESNFKKALSQNNMTENTLRNNYRERVKEELFIQNYVSEKIRPNITITERELKEFYEENKEKFNKEVKYSYKIAYLKYDISENDIKEIKKKLTNLREKILNHKISFKEAAKKYSMGPSADKGGALEYIQKGSMVADFENVVFNMEEGEISKPFKTKFGYHITYLEDIKNSRRKVYHIVLKPKPSETKLTNYYKKFKTNFENGWQNVKSWGKNINIKFYDFDTVNESKINYKIYNKLKNLEKESISKPFYFNNGIVILYLADKTESEQMKYVEIKSRIKRFVMSKKIQQKMDKMAEKLKDKYFVRIFL